MPVNLVSQLDRSMLGDGIGGKYNMVVFGDNLDTRPAYRHEGLRPPEYYTKHPQSDFLMAEGDTRKYSHGNAFEVAAAIGPNDNYSGDMTLLPEHKEKIVDSARNDFEYLRTEYMARTISTHFEPDQEVNLYLPVDQNGKIAVGADYGGLPEEMQTVMDEEMALTMEFCRIVDQRKEEKTLPYAHVDKEELYDEIMAEAKRNLKDKSAGQEQAPVPAQETPLEGQEQQDLAAEEERKKKQQQGRSDDFPERGASNEQQASSSKPEERRPESRKQSATALWGSYLKDIEGKEGYKKIERGEGQERVVEHRFVPEKDQQGLVAEGNGHYTQVTGPEGVALSGRANGSVDIAVGDDGSKLNVLCSSSAEIASGKPSVKIDATEISDQAPNHLVSVGPGDKKVTLQFSAGGEVSLCGDRQHKDIAEDIELTVNGPEGVPISAGFRFDEHGQESLYNRDTGEALSFDKEQGGYALATTGPEQDGQGQEQDGQDQEQDGQGQEQEAPGQEQEGQDSRDDGFQEDIPSADLPQREWDQLSESDREAARSTGADKLHLDNPYEDEGVEVEGNPMQDAMRDAAAFSKGMAEMELVDGETLSAPDGAMSLDHLEEKRAQQTSI